jgi:hypothetical protein
MERPIANPGHRFEPGTLPTDQCRCYLESAPLDEVMFDQLEYLVTHAGRDCPPECPDCARLLQVRKWLLLPFRTVVH